MTSRQSASPSIRLLALFTLLFAAGAHAQSAFNWRSFTAANGLTNAAISSVTIGPREAVWLKHEEFSTITRYDGYQFDTFPYPYPGFIPSRVFEGLSGQLWAVDKEAVVEFSNGSWHRYPLPQVRREFARNLRRVTQPISLIPLRINNVLILLSDQLLKFDSLNNEVTTIKRADDVNIGEFKSMIETGNQQVLVSGENGIAMIKASARSLTPNTPWVEHLPSEEYQLRAFQRPTENADGSISMVATGERQKRLITSFKDGNWDIESAGDLKLRFAWKGATGGFWGQSYNAIHRISKNQRNVVGQDKVSAGLLLDVAVQSPNVFYIASSEGLFRHAPSCWAPPPALIDIDSSIHAILEDRDQRIWCLNAEALLGFEGETWTRTPWPEEFDIVIRPGDSLFQLDSNRLLIGNGPRHFVFDMRKRRIRPFELPNGFILERILGVNRDGSLILRLTNPKEGSPQIALLRGDEAPVSFDTIPLDTVDSDFIVETKNQETWISDDAGLSVLEATGKRRFGREQGLPADRATCLIELDNGLIWAGLGPSIYEFDGKRWKLLFSTQERINQIVQASDKSVWAASNSGIHRFHYDSWVSLTTEDGLPGNTIYSLIEDSRGQIWAGTTRGLCQYKPQADLDAPRSNIRVLANSPRVTRGNSKRAVFEAVDKWDFTPQDRLLFSYRLDERPWTPYSEQNELLLEGLSAGQHRLEVRAMDRNWNEEAHAADYQFMWIVPWYDDPRLIIISAICFGVIFLLAGLAINRHIRLVKSYSEVEKIVALRTEELENANRELLQTQKMRALGTLSAGIAHDFNGILSIIRGSTQIIESNLSNQDKVKTRLERIRLVVDQGAGVIRAMLGLARSGENHLKLIDVNESIETTIRLMDDRLPKELEVVLVPGKEIPSVRVVVDLLQQSLVNLISNASDAMDGQGRVEIKTRHLDSSPPGFALKPASSPDGYIEISVCDSGYGISAEVLPRIFEPFFTSKSFSSKRGTGLGLSMVYEMAREMRAGLAVSSTAGKGSRFTILIPVTDRDTSSGVAAEDEQA